MALVAYAVGPDGHRVLLGVALGVEESEASWSELLQQLTDRGLTGVELVIADEHAGLAAVTTFYAFPPSHWKKIRTTNGLERLHGEIKRRTKAIGAFPDRASALRLITAVALKVATIWGERRYVDVSLLENQEVDQAA